MFTGTYDPNDLESLETRWRAEEEGNIPVAFRRIYGEMAGRALDGLILSQIVYWHKPSKRTGKPRLQVVREGNRWLAKARSQWFEECAATEDEARRAIMRLSRPRKLRRGVLKGVERPGLIEVRKWKFAGAPTTHIRIIWENFLRLYFEAQEKQAQKIRSGNLPNRNGNLPDGNATFAQSLTETTPETTNRDLRKEEVRISEKSEIVSVLEMFEIPESLKEKAIEKLTPDEIIAACWLTNAHARINPYNYLAKLLRSWLDDSGERESGVKSVRHIWKCKRCETLNDRSTYCKSCFDDRDEAGGWVVPREAVS